MILFGKVSTSHFESVTEIGVFLAGQIIVLT